METPFHILSLTGAGDFRQRRHLARRCKGAATTESIPFQRVFDTVQHRDWRALCGVSGNGFVSSRLAFSKVLKCSSESMF